MSLLAVIVGLSPIFRPSSSSVEVTLSAFPNLNHAVPLLYPPRPPALQPPSISSIEAYSTILTSSTMVNMSNHIFSGIAYAPNWGSSYFFCNVLSEQQTNKCNVLPTNNESPEKMNVTTEPNFKVKQT
ncbi:hypothetical protein BLNAU_3319 [Blattamonas nauphoetae]|uniref:Uncharacterized protein n=1 Tax=Blattamonas nauphoetae TaxID=2049346 RepID=A0ABQ9YDS3_9EUKA|nr:hypothetical protein BLNAU_3319 [Blattamonas nauphoetae]